MTRREQVLEQLFLAMERQEGHLPWHRSKRNKNPLNLRKSPFQWFRLGDFSVFRSYEAGKRAALWDINQKLNKATYSPLFKEKGDKATIKDLVWTWMREDNSVAENKKAENYLAGVLADLNKAGIVCDRNTTFEELFKEPEHKKELKILFAICAVPRRESFDAIIGSFADYLNRAFEGTKRVSVDVLDLDKETKLEYMIRNIAVGADYTVRKFEIVKPEQIRQLVEGKIKGHSVLHLIDGDQRGLTSSLRETVKGAVINQHNVIPSMNEAVFLQDLIHEFCHSLYTLLDIKGVKLIDDVHLYSGIFDPRPEANFNALIKKLEKHWNLL